MKLKQFMANSLPRSKNKNKKKEAQPLNNKVSHDTNTLKAVPVEVNKHVKNAVIEKSSSVEMGVITIPIITHTDSKAKNTVTMNKSLVMDDFTYMEEKLAPLGKNEIFNVNFNLNTQDSKCACYKHIQPAYSPELTKKDTLLFSFGDNNFNTIPRTRTRIRTNPWLPSPKTTPSVSPASSMSASPSDSPTDSKNFESGNAGVKADSTKLDIVADTDNSQQHRETVNVGRQANTSHNSLNIKAVDCHTNQEAPIALRLEPSMYRSYASVTDNSAYASIPEEEPESPTFPIYIEEAQGISSCENISAEIVEKIIDPKHLEAQVSFQYEEAFESQIEAGVDDLDLDSSLDDLSIGYGSRDDVFLDSSLGYDSDTENSVSSRSFSKESAVECCYDSDSDEEVWKRRDESAAETDDTLCDEPKYMGSVYMRYDSRIREVTPPKNKGIRGRKGGKRMTESDLNSVGSTSVDSGACSEGSSLGSEDANGRRVGAMQSSLHDKVNRLRQEKLIVDEKIRQAQEEERLRVQEKMRFQKQLTLHRKQILLRTLQDLKQKLENQSHRLQSTYSSVIGMQKNFIRNKRHMRAHEIQDFQEAPF